MKVLEKGRDSIGWSKELICSGKGNEGVGCGAKLLVEENDLYYVSYYSWGERESCYTFVCPECGCMNDITSCLPSVVHDKANQKSGGSGSVVTVQGEAARVKQKLMERRN